MHQVHARLQDSLHKIARQSQHDRAAAVLDAFWKLISSRSHLPYMRLLFEVQMLAVQNPKRYARYLADTSNSWLRLISRALPPLRPWVERTQPGLMSQFHALEEVSLTVRRGECVGISRDPKRDRLRLRIAHLEAGSQTDRRRRPPSGL